jgi:hypothetical protein
MNAVSKSPSPVLAGANQATGQITESDAELSEILKEVSPVALALSAVHIGIASLILSTSCTSDIE